jgi:hypothetical protein
MEKGLKNLNQAYRSAQKKTGTYEEGDSGIGHSDFDEEHDGQMPIIPEVAYQQQGGLPTQRMQSIQYILQDPLGYSQRGSNS